MPQAHTRQSVISCLSAFAILSVPAQNLLAQDASGPSIIVTGKPLTKAELREKSETFVRAAAVLPDDGQFARRFDPVCPSVSGVDAQIAKQVGGKIREVAQKAGIAVAGANCRTNILVNFTDDVDNFFVQSRKIRPGLLSGLRPYERTTLFESKAPIRWFYTTAAMVNGTKAGLQLTTGSANPLTEGDLPPANRGSLRYTSSSLIQTNIAVNLTSTVVVVDVNAASGSLLDSVAAYAAMVSLAQIQLDGDYAAYPSILAMYRNGKALDEAPRDLTEWDYAYLRGLYTMPSNREARVQRPKILGAMVEDLATPER